MSRTPLALPHSATLAWWLTAWLRGHEQTDHVLDALADDGGALSSYEVERRRDLLQPLGRAARRAIVAACSPEVWPGG
jgi:hypothetical protein